MRLTTTIFVLMGLIINSGGQITITSADMPDAGDTIRRSHTVNLAGIDFTVTGEDHLWDFPALEPIYQTVDTFVDVSSTPWLYQLAFLGAANLARPMQDFDQIPGFQVTDAYEFYNNLSSDYSLAGFGVTINGLPVPNKFDSPDVIYRFPVSYGNVDSSFSEYEIVVPGLGYAGGWKKRVNTADGWGTLTTPYGAFDALRLRSEVDQYDSVYIDSLGMGLPMSRQYVEYKWLGNGMGLPLCVATEENFAFNVVYIDSVRSLITSAPSEVSSEDKFTIFPNPCPDRFHVSFNLDSPAKLTMILYSVSGKRLAALADEQISPGSVLRSYDARALGLEEGFYLLKIRLGAEEFTGKLLVR